MRVSGALLPAWLFVGACTSALAQTKIVETAPGTQSSRNTNAVNPGTPARVPSGNLFDRMYRPGKVRPPDVGLYPSPSSTGAKIDPAVRQRLIDDQLRKKNWAIENAARINRNGGDLSPEPRRSETERRKPNSANPEPTAAELRLQAVDPQYARDYQELTDRTTNSDNPLVKRRAKELFQGKDSGDQKNPDDAQDPNEALDDFDQVNQSKEGTADDPLAGPLLGPGAGSLQIDAAFGRTARPPELDLLGPTKDPISESVPARFQSLRSERDSELAEILGIRASTENDGERAPADSFGSPILSSRMAAFQQLLAADAVPPAASKLTADTSPSTTANPFSDSAGAAGLGRNLPNFSAPNATLNQGTTPAPVTFAPPQRITAQPAKLPFPVRGQGGF